MPAPYLTLDEAKSILDRAVGSWNCLPAHKQGWSIFNLPMVPHADVASYIDVGIERFDDPTEFPAYEGKHHWGSDQAVDTALQGWAAEGDTYALETLHIHHAADSIRFHLWGPDWVDSRCGPADGHGRHG
jgi:hypothetical protein